VNVIKEIVLEPADLAQFIALQPAAVDTVSGRFYAEMSSFYLRFGDQGRQSCSEDIQFTLDFLRPVLEFGFLQPFVDYLRWLCSILAARNIPAEHVVTSIDWIGDYYGAHLSESGSGKFLSAVRAAKDGLQGASALNAVSEIDKNMPTAWPECKAFMQALLQGNRRTAGELFMARIQSGASFVDVELHLVQPALYQVGRDWQDNKVTVAQEHLATATAVTLMAQAFPGTAELAASARKAVFACVQGNEHEVGLRIVADAFELEGWNVRFLGANTPSLALVDLAKSWEPDLVGLSVSFPHQFKTVKELIAQLRAALGNSCPAVMVGGLAFNGLPSAAPIVAADAYSPDARAAIGQANHLMGLP